MHTIPIENNSFEGLEKQLRKKFIAFLVLRLQIAFRRARKNLDFAFIYSFLLWILFCNTNKCAVLQTFVNS
tara:strand:- start:249 stop:461 length:213 start_codon:yes stop_codon:yes gene_type:complete